MKRSRVGERMVLAISSAVLLGGAAALQAAETPATATNAQPHKTVRLLAIGNSFSQNATEYLPQIVASQGDTLVLGQAAIGGCSLEKHWNLAQKNEADPNDREGKSYYLPAPDGKYKKVGLKEFLQAEAWDVVTIHQVSGDSWNLKTYRPYAQFLSEYVRRNAPQAKLWVSETWAYRVDNPLLKKYKLTRDQMYQSLHDAYATIAAEVHAEGIIPAGSAFQNVLHDPRWQSGVQVEFNAKGAKYPEAPDEPHALNTGWRWDKRTQPPSLGYDGKHLTTAGKYLAALVWYETFFGAVHGTVFVPKGLSPEDAAILREIAHNTAREGLRPAPVAMAAAAPAAEAQPAVAVQALADQTKLDAAPAPAADPNAVPREQALARVDLAPVEGLALGKIVGGSGVKVSVQKGVSGGICELPVTADEWKEGTIRFTPAADGAVTIKLRGHYVEARSIWVYFDEVKAEGATIENGGFEKAGEGGRQAGWTGDPQCKAQRMTDAGGAKSGEAYAKVCHGGIGTLKQNLRVTKDMPVTLTFWARSAAPVARE